MDRYTDMGDAENLQQTAANGPRIDANDEEYDSLRQCPYCRNHGGSIIHGREGLQCPWHHQRPPMSRHRRGWPQRFASESSDMSMPANLDDDDERRQRSTTVLAVAPPRFRSWSTAAEEEEGEHMDMAMRRYPWRERRHGNYTGTTWHHDIDSGPLYLLPWRPASPGRFVPFHGQQNNNGNEASELPTWQTMMQDMLHSFLGGGRGLSLRNSSRRHGVVDYASDPGDYLEDSRGFENLLLELADNTSDHGPPPASHSAIQSLPSVVIRQNHIDDDDSASCPVCKEQMQLHEIAKELPCLHLYHEECIVPWLKVRNTCPVCRYELPTDDADYEARKRENRTWPTNASSAGLGQSSNESNSNSSSDEERDANVGMDHYPVLRVIRHSNGGGYYEDDDDEYDGGGTRSRGWLWFAARIMGIFLILTIGTRLISPRPRRHLHDTS